LTYGVVCGIITLDRERYEHAGEAEKANRTGTKARPRFEDLDKLLRAYGFEVRRPGRGGSHYYCSKGRVKVSVPKRHPHVLPIYVLLALKAIDQAEEEREEE
jgi:hypothetical protein